MGSRAYLTQSLTRKRAQVAEDIELIIQRFTDLKKLSLSDIDIPASLSPDEAKSHYRTLMLKLEDISVRLLSEVVSVLEESTIALQQLQIQEPLREAPKLASSNSVPTDSGNGGSEGLLAQELKKMAQPKQPASRPEPLPPPQSTPVNSPTKRLVAQPVTTSQPSSVPSTAKTEPFVNNNSRKATTDLNSGSGWYDEEYAEKFDDPVEVHLGYKPDSIDPQICRYYNKGRCKQGNLCEWKHINVKEDNILKKQQMVTYNTPSNDFNVGRIYLVRVVGVDGNIVHVMLLNNRPLTREMVEPMVDYDPTRLTAESAYLREYAMMLAKLTKVYQSKPTEPASTFPAIGSLVAVPEDEEANRYERARVIDFDIQTGKVMLKYLESGMILSVNRRVVFNLTEEFALLPPLVNDFINAKNQESWLNTFNEQELISMPCFAKIVDLEMEGHPVAMFYPFTNSDDVVRILNQLGK